MNSLQAQFEGQQAPSYNIEASKSREMAEVQSQIFLAKQFPRNEYQAEMKIAEACKRLSLAETALYQFPKGNQKVIGPSIRLAEMVARYWGNISYGIKEVEQKKGESTMLAYAWDMETNTRVEKTFHVKHELYTKNGIKQLNDPRDIYEHTANLGTRRLRACILGVVPGDVVENATEICKQTMQNGYKEPLKDRLVKATSWLKDNYGITQEMVEETFGYKFESFNEQDFQKLRTISQSLKDDMAKREDFFKLTSTKEPKTSLEKQFKEGATDGAAETNEG